MYEDSGRGQSLTITDGENILERMGKHLKSGQTNCMSRSLMKILRSMLCQFLQYYFVHWGTTIMELICLVILAQK